MPIFTYKAYNAFGADVSGSIEASNSGEAVSRLRKDGLYPRAIALPASGAPLAGARRLFGAGVTTADLAAVTRRLSTLTSSGTALFEAIDVLAVEEGASPLGHALIGVKEAIAGGASLANALRAHHGIFPELYVSTVEAAEASGTLDEALGRLAEYMERRARIMDKIRTALVYPVLMMCVAFIVLVFLFIFVIPRIAGIFEDTGQSLPLITKALLAIADNARRFWYLIIIALIAASTFGRRWLKTDQGKKTVDGLLFKLPVVKGSAVKFYSASFAMTLGSLLANGVPILAGLEMTKRVLNNAVLALVLDKAIREVREGMALSTSLKDSKAFPVMLVHMTATGEKSGALGAMLLKAADSYERELESTIVRTLSLLEPALMLAMGAVVAFIVLAILLPIFEINQIIR
ncbi:MAG: type II secretion system F family protein [Deltaproteobacteria bacterium]|nr:type II secretion system F family protein [Deltaproteobacteria bacterium]